VLSVQIFQKWYVVWEIVECHQCPRRPYMFLFMWVMEMLCWIFDNSRVLSVTASAIFQMLTWSALLLFNLNLAFVHSHFHDTEVICISSIWLSLLAKMLETLDTLIKSVVIWQFQGGKVDLMEPANPYKAHLGKLAWFWLTRDPDLQVNNEGHFLAGPRKQVIVGISRRQVSLKFIILYSKMCWWVLGLITPKSNPRFLMKTFSELKKTHMLNYHSCCN
jgi:hypothetical protein